MESEQVQKIIDVLQTSGSNILNNYISWYITSSAVWCVVSMVGLLYTIVYFKPDSIELKTVKFSILAVLILMFTFNIIDLISPDGIATHRLIKDLRG